jgi:glycogen synthase
VKILVLSNLYPPHFIGGYELGCQDVVEGLKTRGHQVRVLTSTHGVAKPECDGEVYRWLEWDGLKADASRLSRFSRVIRKEMRNRRALTCLLRVYRPDIVYAWNLAGISVSLLFLSQQLRLQVCYFIFDEWLAGWENDLAYAFWSDHRQLLRVKAKACLRPLARLWKLTPSGSLDLRYAQFASEYLKERTRLAGKPVEAGEIASWGIDTQKFRFREELSTPKRLLYAGQLVPQKGVDTAIKAVRVLVQNHGHGWEGLTIVGPAETRPDYVRELQGLVESYGLSGRVSFHAGVSRDQLVHIYHEHDILLFPSVWDEPFGITLLEAMSCGLAVVATATGGTPEILKHDTNALIFPKRDAVACAGHIERLLDDDELFDRIRNNGRRMVERGFGLESLIARVEDLLMKAASGVPV